MTQDAEKRGPMSETLVDAVLAGKVIDLEEAFDDAVCRWHEDSTDSRTLEESLGLTWQEYSMWVEDPRSLSFILSYRRFGLDAGVRE